MAHISRSRPNSGLGVQAKVLKTGVQKWSLRTHPNWSLKTGEGVPFSLGGGGFAGNGVEEHILAVD